MAKNDNNVSRRERNERILENMNYDSANGRSTGRNRNDRYRDNNDDRDDRARSRGGQSGSRDRGHSSSGEKSYSQQKRDSFPYRTEYFRKNPGLFGCIWFCAYCKTPLVGRGAVEVDHVTPLNSALGVNKTVNLVAACRKCNREKSDKLEASYVAKGYSAKIGEVVLGTVQKLVVVSFVAIWVAVLWAFRLAGMILALPFKSRSWKVKIIAAVFYAIIIYLLFNSLMRG